MKNPRFLAGLALASLLCIGATIAPPMLRELQDVRIRSSTNDTVLVWRAALGKWTNEPAGTLTNLFSGTNGVNGLNGTNGLPGTNGLDGAGVPLRGDDTNTSVTLVSGTNVVSLTPTQTVSTINVSGTITADTASIGIWNVATNYSTNLHVTTIWDSLGTTGAVGQVLTATADGSMVFSNAAAAGTSNYTTVAAGSVTTGDLTVTNSLTIATQVVSLLVVSNLQDSMGSTGSVGQVLTVMGSGGIAYSNPPAGGVTDAQLVIVSNNIYRYSLTRTLSATAGETVEIGYVSETTPYQNQGKRCVIGVAATGVSKMYVLSSLYSAGLETRAAGWPTNTWMRVEPSSSTGPYDPAALTIDFDLEAKFVNELNAHRLFVRLKSKCVNTGPTAHVVISELDSSTSSFTATTDTGTSTATEAWPSAFVGQEFKKLSVFGDQHIYGSLNIATNANITNNLVVGGSATVTGAVSAATLTLSNTAATGPTLSVYASNNPTPNLFVSSNGNVGVGTATPETKVHIMESGSSSAAWASSSVTVESAGDNYFEFLADGGETLEHGLVWSDSTPARGKIVYLHSDDSMRISTLSTEWVRITSGGNVGIGTNAPAAALHVLGSTATNQFVFIADSPYMPNAAPDTNGILSLATNGNLWVNGSVSCESVVDHSDSPTSLADAVAIVNSHEVVNGKVDHSKLSPLAYSTKTVATVTGKLTNSIPAHVEVIDGVTNNIPETTVVSDKLRVDTVPDPTGRNLSKVISAQQMVIKDLLERLAALESTVSQFQK